MIPIDSHVVMHGNIVCKYGTQEECLAWVNDRKAWLKTNPRVVDMCAQFVVGSSDLLVTEKSLVESGK